MRYINTRRIIAAQITTPAENPLLTEESCMIDVWFEGEAVRKQLFKKVTRAERENFIAEIVGRGFIQSGNLYMKPTTVLFAEMENELLGGVVTIGYQDNGRPIELKVSSKVFDELCTRLSEGSRI